MPKFKPRRVDENSSSGIKPSPTETKPTPLLKNYPTSSEVPQNHN